jgi:sulfur relay protein TusD/DsrE
MGMKNITSQRFAMTVTASPHHSDQAQRALRFAQVIQQSQHQLTQIFFYGDGVLCALPDSVLCEAWTIVAKQVGCPLYVCVSAAQRRAIDILNTPWQLVGLGDWVNGLQAEQHLHFGGARYGS